MAKIDIRRRHGQTLKAAKAKVDKTAVAIGKKFGLHHEWNGDELHFHRFGVEGHIHVTKHEVRVHADLGFLFGAMKPAIEQEIEDQLDKNFG